MAGAGELFGVDLFEPVGIEHGLKADGFEAALDRGGVEPIVGGGNAICEVKQASDDFGGFGAGGDGRFDLLVRGHEDGGATVVVAEDLGVLLDFEVFGSLLFPLVEPLEIEGGGAGASAFGQFLALEFAVVVGL